MANESVGGGILTGQETIIHSNLIISIIFVLASADDLHLLCLVDLLSMAPLRVVWGNQWTVLKVAQDPHRSGSKAPIL